MDKKPSHISTGIRKILEIPLVYNTFQTLHGGNKQREKHFRKYFSDPSIKKVLDIGCGTGVLLNHLAPHIEYHGCDMEASYIAHAKEKFGNRGHFYQERVGEVIKEEWIGYFDAINAHGLLHHLEDKDIEHLLSICYKYLVVGGKMVTIDATFYESQPKFSKWIVSKDRGQNIKTPTEYKALAARYFNKIEGILNKTHNRLQYSVYTMVLTK